ncbi:MAG: 3-methyl-2-oxobutanoate hydroxymethyltransferase [Candidatus Hermodarchaeota archaeon]
MKITVPMIRQMKGGEKKIVMLTAYDALMASIIDEAGIDIILVGDSVGNVLLGYQNTLPVTIDDMVRHCAAVARGTQNALIVGDMPFMSYEASVSQAIKNAGRLIKEGGAHAVKLEGGRRMINQVRGIISAGIPVMGHIGLTPQSINHFGGHKVQGKTEKAAMRLVEDARILEEAGVFAIVLEGIPWQVAEIITPSVSVPTIGIGAGLYTDGQVLVTQDLLGFTNFKPTFLKKYLNIREIILKALKEYKADVEGETFPSEQYSYSLSKEEEEKLRERYYLQIQVPENHTFHVREKSNRIPDNT